eukprot:UN09693
MYLCKDLLINTNTTTNDNNNNNNNNNLNYYDTFLIKTINIYKQDIIPYILTGTSTINNAVLRLLKQQIETLLYVYIQFNLTSTTSN